MPLYNPLAVMRLRSDKAVQYRLAHAGYGKVRNNNTKNHQGWDLYASEGTPAFALGDGLVMWTMTDPSNWGDYGRQLLIQFNGDGSSVQSSSTAYYAFYAHLSKIAVVPGAFVKAKDVVAFTGTSGNAEVAYPHLHFEIRSTAKPLGKGLAGRIDPSEVLGRYLLSNNTAQVGGVEDQVQMVCRVADTPALAGQPPSN
jgi:murein DD-endopeptidase MepM/ murein hydrolase activator NlpD